MQVDASREAHGIGPPVAWPGEPGGSQLRIALSCAARAADLELDPEALVAATALGARLSWRRPVESLARVLGQAGLRARMGGLEGDGPGPGPAIAMLAGPSPMLLISSGRRGRRYPITEVGASGRTTVRLSARALSSRYGAGGLTWLQLEPALPLERLRSPGRGPASPWLRTLALLSLDRNDIAVVLVYAVAIGALTLAAPVAVQALVTNVAFGTVFQPVVVLTLLLAVGLSFSAILRAFQAVVVEVVQQRVFVRVVSDLAHRLPRVERDALEHRDGRELANRFFEVVTLQKSMASLLIDGLGLVLQTFIGFALLAVYHPLLLAFGIALALVLVLVISVLGRGAVRSAIKESAAKYATAAWIEALAAQPLLWKSGGGPRHAAQRADELAHGYLDARRVHFRHLLAQTVGGLAIQVLASTALLGLGGALVLDGQLTLGQLVAAELVVAALGTAFARIGKQLEQLYDLVAAATKLAKLIDLPGERTSGEPLHGEGPARLRVHDPALGEAADLHVVAGARVGLGGSELAATRIVDAVAGLEPLPRGWVELDGVDLRGVELVSLRRAVALVRSDDAFAGTVLDNLRLGRPELTQAEAHGLLRAVGLADDIASLPRGLDEPLVLGGHPLRRGQRRRLALARALAAQPRLLVVDGLLDGLVRPGDPLLDALFDREAPFTLLVVSGDPRVLARCDEVFTDQAGDPS